ncbi:hypothetical protein HBI56_122450 [Parastagonospora nodorum]|uniref:Uncharacterized protein n=1 Tax=Phaeosphaeria nodorum (strain SN15 / ATCC MYA-4574 / FGSC 10173) TaxID=321614 RepID=A0A7U2I795_PHANO|nr:hypothetical protein HBH56_052240 [Parastagonospora nodorum]QRD02163.1 hypothetical protein JI435_417600 [Parastagonospora nodorum SN15]KAH3935413.1 hypothetical protein HBH54_038040 [Parastagonospora nodorum]KAH3948453.1 hypothetical protein HBH53_101130 [Parastagonospora nodorum]KAH3970128.1 hypothetical protein HBH51_118040 [Parastagonospora nodorum]
MRSDGVRSSARTEGTTLSHLSPGKARQSRVKAHLFQLQDLLGSMCIQGMRRGRSKLAVTSTIIFHA